MTSELNSLLEEKILDPSQSYRGSLKRTDSILESNRKRRRVFTTLILCVVIYFITSSHLESKNSQSEPLQVDYKLPFPVSNRVNQISDSDEQSTESSTNGGTTDQNDSLDILIETTTSGTPAQKLTTKIPKQNKITAIENANKSGETLACKIPKLDPYDPSIRHFLRIYPRANCALKFDLLFEMGRNSTLSTVNNNAKIEWKDCCYRVITRSNYTESSNPDNAETYSKKCYPITRNQTEIPDDHEFIAVECTPTKQLLNSTGKPVPKVIDVFAFTPLKPLVEERIFKLSKNQSVTSKPQVNLVVLGIDAVSHMNFIRIMPKVRNYLINNLSAIEMNGYAKIGDNTYPNIVAALTPWNSSEIKERCMNKSEFLDDCPFIWKNFSAQGYRTAYGEDSPWMGIFNYLKKGFQKPPVDYYLRPFFRAAAKYVAQVHEDNGHFCTGPKISFEVLLNYMKRLATTMGYDKRYFQFTWGTSLTHNYLNSGQLGEPSLFSTLQWFNTKGYLNNTVFVLMSDHGLRHGPYRQTLVGRIEESMPFLYFVMPDWFRKRYKNAIKNMRLNQGRLTTPYDTYQTFMDILQLENIDEKSLAKRQVELSRHVNKNKVPRGISMFLPIPENRTCRMAEIADHWCICHSSQTVSTKSGSVKQAANYAVYSLNALISNYTKCAYLTLSSIISAQLVHAQNSTQNSTEVDAASGERIFELAFVTSPGNGSFEATVIKNSEGSWIMSGWISRTNLYGNQSHCVNDKEMKKYCFCVDTLILK